MDATPTGLSVYGAKFAPATRTTPSSVTAVRPGFVRTLYWTRVLATKIEQ